MSARIRFNVTVEDRYTRYGTEDLTLHLYEYPVTINSDYTITGTRATDSSGDPIAATDKGDGQYEMAVVDVLERPQLAEDEKILATPTLIKELPPPLRRVIGDLSDKEKVLLGLDLLPATHA